MKKADVKPPCRHEAIHFETGGLHIVCNGCGRAWTSVINHPLRNIFDPTARALGLTELDERHNPNLSLPRYHPTNAVSQLPKPPRPR